MSLRLSIDVVGDCEAVCRIEYDEELGSEDADEEALMVPLVAAPLPLLDPLSGLLY